MDILVSDKNNAFPAVSSAILNLYLSYNSASGTGTEIIQVYQVTSESVTIDNSATWNSIQPNNVPSYTLVPLITSLFVTNSPERNDLLYPFNITSLISSLTASTTKVTLCLKAGTQTLPIEFWSRDYTTTTYCPALAITDAAVTSVTVSPGTATVAVGAKSNLTVTVALTNAVNKTVSWYIMHRSISTIIPIK